jgi:phosphoglycolate phosphatase-like HAD superfamily hydrolase
MIILTDIDHTVANAFWRDSMIGVNPWDEYHEQSKYDKPFKRMVSLLNSLSNSGYTIIGVTGRNEKFRQLTTNWFLKYKIDIHELLMRPDDNFMKNAVLKLMLIEERFNGDYKDVHFLIDDNEDAAIEFFKMGIATLQVRNINGGERGAIKRADISSTDGGGSYQNNEGEK